MKKTLFTLLMMCCLTVTVQAQDEAMPDTTNLQLMFDLIKNEPNNETKFSNYVWLVLKTQREQPDNWELQTKILCNMGIMQMEAQAPKEALDLYNDALNLVDKQINNGTVVALYYSSMIRLNATGVFKQMNDTQSEAEQYEMAGNIIETFLQNVDSNDTIYSDKVEECMMTRFIAPAGASCAYDKLKNYDKAYEMAQRAMKTWDEYHGEDKPNLEFMYCMAQVMLAHSAVHLQKMEDFYTASTSLEKYLVSLFSKMVNKEVELDDNAKNTYAGLAQIQMSSYGTLKDWKNFKRLEELALLFDPSVKTQVDYEKARYYAQGGRKKDALKIYKELMKDDKFVNDFLKDGDPVGELLGEVSSSNNNSSN